MIGTFPRCVKLKEFAIRCGFITARVKYIQNGEERVVPYLQNTCLKTDSPSHSPNKVSLSLIKDTYSSYVGHGDKISLELGYGLMIAK